MVELIAEIGVAHLGNMKRAEKLINRAADSKFDAVKFQYFQSSKKGFEHLSKYELSVSSLDHLCGYANALGLKPIVSVFRADDLLGLVDNAHPHAIKIPTTAIEDYELLSEVNGLHETPVYISLGASDSLISGKAVKALNCVGDLTVLKCTAAYPTKPIELNLGDLPRFRDRVHTWVSADYWANRVRRKVRVGVSSHCPEIGPMCGAVTMGAEVLEMHVGLGDADEPDYASSINIALNRGVEFCHQIRCTQDAIKRNSNGVFAFVESERNTMFLRHERLMEGVE